SPERFSGTGGFALYGESTIPVQDNPGTPEGRRKLKLDFEPGLAGVGIVPLKVKEGDDASCLNLNRAQSPRLLGVDPRELASRGAFQPRGGRDVWRLLEEKLPDGSVPALAGDANTAAWGLKVKTGREKGGTLLYRDERGQEFSVKLVGSLPVRLSVFQGSVIIKTADFTEKFPSESGYQAFLVDAPRGAERKAGEILARRLGRAGVDFVPAVERLKEFYAVESTYLNMFLVLGGLGLILGSAGMGVVVLRNIMERKGELSLLRAVGYSPARVRRVVFIEHWLLLAAGLAVGILSSLAAMWPALAAPGVKIPLGAMALIAGGMAAFNLAWIYFCVRLALRAPLLPALRNE
ncbi:MAG: ABC transporter permease, partial [Kiritimatiellia bacterium]